MRILFLSGIWPPDVGGPATHGPDFSRFLVEAGHGVRVLTMADGEVSERPCPVETVSRSLPFPLRYGRLTALAALRGRRATVIYATATYAAAALAAKAAQRPLVAKLVSDPAYERAVRYGLFDRTLEEFQHSTAPLLRSLKAARSAALGVASAVVVPSRYLAEIAAGWGLDSQALTVLPNPAPAVVPPSVPREPGLLVFAGRLVRQKNVTLALEALAQLPQARLELLGDGPDRGELERRAAELGLHGRVVFRGSQPREQVLRALARAQAAVLPSDWENLPHAAVEALALGTPVIATPVGGVPEVVEDGVNGLLFPPGASARLADAVRRLLDDPALRERLAQGARVTAERLSRERIYAELARTLELAGR